MKIQNPEPKYINTNETLSKREFTSLDKCNCFDLHQQCQRLNSKTKDFSAAMAEHFIIFFKCVFFIILKSTRR